MIQHRIENGVEEKYCCDCKLWVPVVDFYKEKDRLIQKDLREVSFRISKWKEVE